MAKGEIKAKKHWVAAVIEDVFKLFIFVGFGIGLPIELLQIMMFEKRPGGSLHFLKQPTPSPEGVLTQYLFLILPLCHMFLVGWFMYSSWESKRRLIPFRKKTSADHTEIPPFILLIRILLVFYVVGVVALFVAVRAIVRVG